MVRKGSNSIPNQGVKVRISTFKISNKIETNSKDRDSMDENTKVYRARIL